MLRLTSDEFKKALDIFVDCHDLVKAKMVESEKTEVDAFIEKISLMVPCLSLRPDNIQEYNDKIFKSVVLTHFIFDLSFRFFTMAGDYDDFISRLASNLEEGLTIDGPNTHYNIIPSEIASSCPVNLFNVAGNSFGKMLVKSISNNNLNTISFLTSNKHFIIMYLLYLVNQ